jgi:hypothetical protein
MPVSARCGGPDLIEEHIMSTSVLPAPANLRKPLLATAIAFAILFLGLFLSTGETPDEHANAEEIAAFYGKHLTAFRIGAFGLVIAAVLMVFVGALLRRLLVDERDGWGSAVGAALFGGTVVYAIGLTGFAASTTALASATDAGQISALVALNVADTTTFLPVMAGLSATLLATGLAGLRSARMPHWLAWASVVLGVIAVAGPGGFLAFFVFPLWVVLTAVLVGRRASETSAVAAATVAA